MTGHEEMNDVFSQWEDRLVPVKIERKMVKNKKTGEMEDKKIATFKPWRKNEQYSDLLNDFDGHNSVGMRTGNGLGVIDVDTKDLSLLNDVWRPIIQHYLENPSTLTVETYSGYHIYVSITDFKLKTTSGKSEKIPYVDFRGEGGMIFVSSTADRVSYEVINDAPLEEPIPSVFKLLPEHGATKESGNVEPKDPNPLSLDNFYEDRPKEVIADILLSITPPKGKIEWMKCMTSVYKNIENKRYAKGLCSTWSKKDDAEYDEAVFEAKWKEITTGTFGKEISLGGLIDLALNEKTTKVIAAIGSKDKTKLEKTFATKGWIKEPHVLKNDLLEQIIEAYNVRASKLDAEPITKEKVIESFSAEAVDDTLAGKPLDLALVKKFFEIEIADIEITPVEIEGVEMPVLYRGATHTIFGVYGTNKTSIAIILAGKMATKENMQVFYLDGENNGKKMQEFAKECGVNYIPSNISSNKIKLLLKHKVDCTDAIIILDSFSAMLPEGKSNNDAKDTTETMRIAVDLSGKLGATVIVVEHATAQSYDKEGMPVPDSAKMEGSQSGKLKLTHMAYKAIPNDMGNYKQGTRLQVVRSREPDITPMRAYIEIPYEGEDAMEDLFDNVEDGI